MGKHSLKNTNPKKNFIVKDRDAVDLSACCMIINDKKSYCFIKH